MKIKNELTTVEGQAGERKEILLADWDNKHMHRKRIAWKATILADIVHLIIEHVGQEDYLRIKS